MNANKELWEKGDFTRIAESMRDSGTALVVGLGVGKGMRVLDLGCGDGTTAIPAAQRGADVLGVDIASNLVAAGNARAEALGLSNCSFQEGDASDLSELDDASFDLVVSIFGAMFAPRPHHVAKEMVRVTKPGGRIVMGNWIPNDPTLVAQILKISSAYSPPPPEGFVSPMTWGVEDEVIERFAGAGIPSELVSFQRDTYTFSYPGSPSELVAAFRSYYGPTMNAFAAAEADGREAELQAELDNLYFATVAPAAFANEPFCGQVLQPYGHAGDRCYGGGHDLFAVKMLTYERAGCVDVANSNNELLESWRCVGANSGYELFYVNDGVRRKGVIRNNNLSFTGYFVGTEACYANEC